MAQIYQPQYRITINGFDVSATIAPYLISIELEDYFDTNFTVSKLDLIFHAKYKRSINWQYKDQLKIELWWLPFPSFKFISAVFYVDQIEDIKTDGGLQTFRVSAMEADPSLGFDYGEKQITLTNKTTKQAITDFKNIYGLSLTENMTSNVYLGTVDNVTSTPTPDLNTVKISFESYADMLRHICNTYGYLGNLSGKNLQIYKIESTFSESSRFFIWNLPEVFSFNSKQSYNNLRKNYKSLYVNHPTNNDLLYVILNPAMAGELNSKTKNVDNNNAYYNRESASERLYGQMYSDFFSGFEVEITCSALPEFKAGNMFLLDSSYGFHEGYHRCTSVRHRIDAGGWIATVRGFPINQLYYTKATYNAGYVGRYQIPGNTMNISQNLKGTISGMTGSQFDNYAKSYNPNYNSALGAAFISEGNKIANLIRADIAFCIALVLTNNFANAELNTKKNPGAIGDVGGAAYATFTDWTTGGIRAEIQHIFAYTTLSGNPADPIVDPRFSFISRGSATTIDALNYKWNGDLDFSTLVREKLKQLYMFLYPSSTISIV